MQVTTLARGRTFSWFVLCLCLSFSGLAWQERAGAGVEYRAVIDAVFAYVPERVPMEVRVRFAYAGREMQVVYAEPEVGSDEFRVTIWFVPDGVPTIADQLQELLERRSAGTVSELARLVRVTRGSFIIPKRSNLGRVLDRVFGLRIPAIGDDRVFLESSEYQLDLLSAGRDLRLTMRGPLGGYVEGDPVFRWMNEVREAVTAYVRVQASTEAH